MRLSFLFLFIPFAIAQFPSDNSISSMSTLSLPSSLPSITSTSTSISISSSLSTSQTIPTSSSTLPPTSSTTPTSASASSPSSVSLASSTPSSFTASTSAATSSSSAPSAPVAVGQPQSSSSPTPTTFINGAGAPTQGSPSSVVVLTSTMATPSSTTTQSSSSPGFFSNTGAVAGTFTVVGLVSIAGVIAVFLLIAKHRRSRSYEEDTEYLDKSPDLSTDPPITQVTSPDEGSSSDHAHYGAPPMALATPPTAYYPDHPYTLHPQGFSLEAYPSLPSRAYPSPYPAASTPDYAAHRIYSPEDYDIAYPPPAPRLDPSIPNSHQFHDVELDSTPVPPTQTALPNALRPSVNSTPSAPKQWASTRFSIDSFYAGIATDTPPPPGRVL